MATQAVTLGDGRVLDEDIVGGFAANLRGTLLQAGDAGYDDGRTVQNGLIDRRPALIARCSGPADVIQAVNFARDRSLLLSVKGGGHNVAGNATNDGGLVLDLSLMTGVHVDAKNRVAHVQGGATWGDLDRETQVFGLATPGGVVSTTGIGGLTLHGGMGHLRSKYGLSIDNLLSVDIVTADGQLRNASSTENDDLFWAVRGAGSNFGVVTSFEFRLHPVGPVVTLCAPAYALEDGPQVLRKWRDLIQTLPDEFTPLAFFWSGPPGFPDVVVGKPIVILAGLHVGSVEEGERISQPFREAGTPLLDLTAAEPFTAVQSGFDAFFPKGLLQYWKSTYLEELSDELLDTLCELAASRPSSMTTMDVWPQRGAAARVGADETAFGRRPPYMVAFESTWTNPDESEANIAWARSAYESMKRFPSGGIYLNFPGFADEPEDKSRSAYGPNYERLRGIKAKYDANNLFRMNHNIPPAE